MTKKEINEIKALYDSVQDCGIRKLCGCYVNSDKETVKVFGDEFYNFPEEEMYKYLEIFRKTLSGTPGKNLMDMEFVHREEQEITVGRAMLEKLKVSGLEDEAAINAFYDAVITEYDYTGNYIILLIFQSYDVPGMTEDGIEMEDASDEVYSYILCSICPMKLTKPGLGFDDDRGEIHTLKQLFAVELPDAGFLYPAFSGRSSDDSMLLSYSRKPDEPAGAYLKNVLDVRVPIPVKQQKQGFTELVSEVLGDEPSFKTVLEIHENLSDIAKIEKNEAQGETVFLDKDAVREAFSASGVSKEKLSSFDTKFDEHFSGRRKKDVDEEEGAEPMQEIYEKPEDAAYVPEKKLFADNVVPTRNYEVRTDDMVLKINSRQIDKLDTRVIDGKRYLMIEITKDLTVNGIPVA
ncbi:MAG: DUF4317 domain-containing protein [Lachnospiraceae bacterium]|nr:DUF4317 domain-containing protein [Lachnospiraceae bacterium]